MSNLKRLIDLCKASVSVTINEHRNYYQTVEQYLEEDDIEDVDQEVINKMVELDTIVELQCYPRTPIGFHLIHHYDVDQAIDSAISIIEEQRKKEPA